MSDASSFDANIITTAVDSTGNTTIGIVQSNVTQSTVADALIVTTGVVGSVVLELDSTATATVITGGKGDKGDTGPTGPQTVRKPYLVPTQSPDGSRLVFTTPTAYVPLSLAVFLNGLQEYYITETSTTQFTFSTPPISTDTIKLEYNQN